MVRIVEYFADKSCTDVGNDVVEILPEMESATGLEVSDTAELSSNNEMADFPSVGMSPDYCSDVSARERYWFGGKYGKMFSKRQWWKLQKTVMENKDIKYENTDGKVYKKEKSDLLSEADIVLFK